TSDPPVLICIDATTGAVRWKLSFASADLPADLQAKAKPTENPQTSCGYAAPTPVADESRVFVLFGSGVVACVSRDGKLQWLKQLDPARRAYGHSGAAAL